MGFFCKNIYSNAIYKLCKINTNCCCYCVSRGVGFFVYLHCCCCILLLLSSLTLPAYYSCFSQWFSIAFERIAFTIGIFGKLYQLLRLLLFVVVIDWLLFAFVIVVVNWCLLFLLTMVFPYCILLLQQYGPMVLLQFSFERIALTNRNIW